MVEQPRSSRNTIAQSTVQIAAVSCLSVCEVASCTRNVNLGNYDDDDAALQWPDQRITDIRHSQRARRRRSTGGRTIDEKPTEFYRRQRRQWTGRLADRRAAHARHLTTTTSSSSQQTGRQACRRGQSTDVTPAATELNTDLRAVSPQPTVPRTTYLEGAVVPPTLYHSLF